MSAKQTKSSPTLVGGFEGLWLCRSFPDPVYTDLRSILLFLRQGNERLHLLIHHSGPIIAEDGNSYGSTFASWFRHELLDGSLRAKNITWGGPTHNLKWQRDDEG